MLAKIKLYAIFALSLAVAVLYALVNREKAKRMKEKARAEKVAKEILIDVNDSKAEIEKKAKENEKRELDKADSGDRSYFDRDSL